MFELGPDLDSSNSQHFITSKCRWRRLVLYWKTSINSFFFSITCNIRYAHETLLYYIEIFIQIKRSEKYVKNKMQLHAFWMEEKLSFLYFMPIFAYQFEKLVISIHLNFQLLQPNNILNNPQDVSSFSFSSSSSFDHYVSIIIQQLIYFYCWNHTL